MYTYVTYTLIYSNPTEKCHRRHRTPFTLLYKHKSDDVCKNPDVIGDVCRRLYT